MTSFVKGKITISVLFVVLCISTVYVVLSPNLTWASKQEEFQELSTKVEGRYILVHLEEELVYLKDGDTTLDIFPIVSQGAPGSYYETIGGQYTHDYKKAVHFSSFGGVYMPWSVHVFGNYFIHGIPYYENGLRVSSSYSGGCIRLEDVHAKRVYDFVTKGMPIIITRTDEQAFSPTPEETPEVHSEEMTMLMVALISLETLKQDDELVTFNNTRSTRKELLPTLLLHRDTRVAKKYAEVFGEREYLRLMNERARTLGLTTTVFYSLTEPVATSYEDYLRFMNYISNYKSYLLLPS